MADPIQDLPGEIWKPLVGYALNYRISNYAVLAREYRVPVSVVSGVVAGRTYQNVGGPIVVRGPGRPCHRTKTSTQDVPDAARHKRKTAQRDIKAIAKSCRLRKASELHKAKMDAKAGRHDD